MKILIMTPFWRRPEIVAEYVKSIERLKQFSEFYIDLLAIVSPDDPDAWEIINILPDYAQIATHKNNPFGAKKNRGAMAAHSFDWDYLLELNSDSIVNPAILDLYKPYTEKKVPFFGLKDLYITDFHTKETLFIPDYNLGMTYGSGRMLHRSAFEYPLWDNDINEGMDDNMRSRLERSGIPDVPIATDEPMLVELKTNTTINHFLALKGLCRRRKEPNEGVISYEIIKDVVTCS